MKRLIINLIQRLLYSRCPNCGRSGVRYIGTEPHGITHLDVYECKHCQSKYL